MAGSIMEINFLWTLKKFLSLLHNIQNGQNIESSPFYAARDRKLRWSLVLYPKGYSRSSRDHLSLFLFLLSNKSHTHRVSAHFELSLKNSTGETLLYRKTFQKFRDPPEGKGYEHFIKLENLLEKSSNYLCNGNLTVHCTLRYQVDAGITVKPVPTKPINHRPLPAGTLAHQLELLYQGGRFTDITFSINGKEFRAHKLLLVSRSPYFANLFQHDITLRLLDYLELQDVRAEVFEQVLHFVYTDSIQNVEEFPEDLLIAANKYQIEALKEACENYLIRTITNQNCINLLLLGDFHCAPRLKEAAITFIESHITELICCPSWQKLKETKPQLLVEMFESHVVKRKRT